MGDYVEVLMLAVALGLLGGSFGERLGKKSYGWAGWLGSCWVVSLIWFVCAFQRWWVLRAMKELLGG